MTVSLSCKDQDYVQIYQYVVARVLIMEESPDRKSLFAYKAYMVGLAYLTGLF